MREKDNLGFPLENLLFWLSKYSEKKNQTFSFTASAARIVNEADLHAPVRKLKCVGSG